MNNKLNLNSQTAGRIISIADGIAIVSGMGGVMSGEVVIFNENGSKVQGLVLTLAQDHICVVILGKSMHLTTHASVFRTGTVISFPVGFNLVGCVIDSLGSRIDGGSPLVNTRFRKLEMKAPGIGARSPVNEPLLTGILGIDSLIPIGRGQRELIIGDRQTGKTSVAVDAIINQRNVINNKQVFCIYVAIGQKRSSVIHLAKRLKKEGAMFFTTIVAATASESAAMKYLAPYAGCTLGEFFRDRGFDSLIVYDDLTKHADAYREMSLLLRRSPSREAYPSDVFYAHSRLLERAAKLNKAYGFGSLTALPIIETQAGDVSAYIPTNVISITDGQIYLESVLVTRGILPAINFGLSVSRVGTRAQFRAVREVSKSIKLDLAQYRELETVARVSSDLDPTSKATIDRGVRLVEILKQPRFKPMAIETQIVLIYAAQSGFFDDLELSDVKGVKEYLIRSGEYSPYSIFIDVNSKLKDFENSVEALLEGAYFEFSKIKEKFIK
jgi:F-type H+-transporting ATPase subunit alpha